MKKAVKHAFLAANLMMLMWALPARAQMQVGENASLNLSGNLAFDYVGNYSNLAPSGHSMGPTGNADLTGYYYSPGFLTFDVEPFYGREQAKSNYRSVFQSKGVNGSASLFSGSNFPGSISYSRTYNGQGSFAIPGVGDLTTHGDSDHLSIGWRVHVPDYPNIAVQFGDGNSNNSVFGADGESSFHSKLFGITANHQLAGFNLNGGFNHNTSNSLFPEFLTGQPAANSETSSNSYNFNVSHLLPMHGSISAGAGRSVVHSESGGDKFNANIDTVSSGVNFAPIRRLDVGASTEYTDNLDGMLYQSLITGGTVLPSSLLSTSTHSLDVNGHASYSLPSAHLLFMATADRRSQSVLGSSISADSLNEMVNYGNDWLGGFLNASMSISETSVSFDHGTKTLGLMDMVSYSRKIQNWNLNGSFNYSRNTQTVLVGYTTSGYGYGAGIGRKLSTYSYFSVNTSGMKSVFNNVAGSGNFSQSYAASYSMKLFAVNGSYNRANGTSILTSEGLTPVNNPPTSAVPLQVLVFNGTSYSFGASTTPMRGLILSGTYSHSISHSLGGTTTSLNTNAQLNTMLQYKVRQLWITGGYLKLQQGFTITGQPAASDSAFYIGVSRWFKFF